MRFLKTSDIAKANGIHPNTVRQYEEIGFLPRVPRGANGYRHFSQCHLDQTRLVCTLNRCSWLGGKIRTKSIETIRRSAEGDYHKALVSAKGLLELVQQERGKAEVAITQLAEWVAGHAPSIQAKEGMSIKEAAAYLDVTVHTLRNWDRNRLVVIPRQPTTGYRRYGPAELRRLMVIRALRRSRFNLMTILWMFRQLDDDQNADLQVVINSLPPGEEDVYHSTNRWLTKVTEVERFAEDALQQVQNIAKQYGGIRL